MAQLPQNYQATIYIATLKTCGACHNLYHACGNTGIQGVENLLRRHFGSRFTIKCRQISGGENVPIFPLESEMDRIVNNAVSWFPFIAVSLPNQELKVFGGYVSKNGYVSTDAGFKPRGDNYADQMVNWINDVSSSSIPINTSSKVSRGSGFCIGATCQLNSSTNPWP